MTAPLIFALPGNDLMAEHLGKALGGEVGRLETRQFPDGESYLRYASDPAGRRVVLVCTLDRPDEKVLRLAFAADAARQLGAANVGLVAPYLSYMRQDRRFAPGEAITSVAFARLLSSVVDWLVTVDPHLHRYRALDEIYTIPARSVHAAPLLSDWIRANVPDPVVIGPDIESRQWVAEVAGAIGAPHRVLRKTRKGDREVEIEGPDLGAFRDRTPVLVDDIISSGRTMIEAANRLTEQRLRPPVCVGIHALFPKAAFDDLRAATSAVVTTNSVVHPSNAIDVSGIVAEAVAALAE